MKIMVANVKFDIPSKKKR